MKLTVVVETDGDAIDIFERAFATAFARAHIWALTVAEDLAMHPELSRLETKLLQSYSKTASAMARIER